MNEQTAPVLDPAGPTRDQLKSEFQVNRYTFLAAAYRHLAVNEHDGEIRVLMVHALAELGLGVPARELLSPEPTLDGTGVTPHELRQCLRTVEPGRVAWAAVESTYRTNLDAIDRTRPDLAGIVRAAELDRSRYQMFASNDGNYHLSRSIFGQLRQWVPTLLDHRMSEQVELPVSSAGPAVIVMGIGPGGLLERIHAATEHDPGGCHVPIYVVEPEPIHLWSWLHLDDRRRLLDDHRVMFFVGPSAVDDYIATLERTEGLRLPGVMVRLAWNEHLVERVESARLRLDRERGSMCDRIIEAQRRRSAERTRIDRADRLRPGATILGVTSRHTTMLQYSMRDIAHAFESLGYRFELLIEDDDHHHHSTLTYGRAVYDHDPALVVLINHFRCEQPAPLGDVPLLTWIQDPSDIVLNHRTGRSFGPYDFACGYYVEQCTTEFEYPDDRFLSTVLPVSTRLFHDGPVADEIAEQYACDVMYVGHRHMTPEALHASWIERAPAPMHAALHHLRDVVTTMLDEGRHLLEPRALTDAVVRAFGLNVSDSDRHQMTQFYLYRLFDLGYRYQTLRWAARWAERTGRTFKLFGLGWDDDPVLGAYAAGPIDHGEPLRCAYRSANLVLLSMPTGFLHQRSYEALASGGFVLARYSPHSFHFMSPPEFVDLGDEAMALPCAATSFPGLDAITFTDEVSFGAMADRHLADADERRRLGDTFRACVTGRFTYEAIIPTILDWIQAGLRDEDALTLARRWQRESGLPPSRSTAAS